ncbi:hypothetical protein TanjilG_28836 [Lupinus angustifolius]|uniref:Uncharacterized protein n=1 Tax=Lupinus angustifolius TaxID=3871 RepID=A0A4P1R8S7_LUPAN|nr:hypothetical protein TanjilG_28836 [Lupinus angustifolius]
MDMKGEQPTTVSLCITPSDDTLLSARVCALSCGFGYCTGQSKMPLLCWAGGIPGKVMMIIGRRINVRYQL